MSKITIGDCQRCHKEHLLYLVLLKKKDGERIPKKLCYGCKEFYKMKLKKRR